MDLPSRLLVSAAGACQQGRAPTKGPTLALVAWPGQDVALACGPQQSKVPVPSTAGGIWARCLSQLKLCTTPTGRDGNGQGQLPGTRQGPYGLLGTQ